MNLVMIRDALMFLFAFAGVSLIGYVRVHFSERQKKNPHRQLDYNEKELKLRKLGIILAAIGVALALIPLSFLQ